MAGRRKRLDILLGWQVAATDIPTRWQLFFEKLSPDLHFFTMTFRERGLESGFVRARAEKVKSSMLRCALATAVGTGAVLVSQSPWNSGPEHFRTVEEMHVMRRSSAMFCGIVIYASLVCALFAVPGITNRVNATVVEVFCAFVVCSGIVLMMLSIPWYAARTMGYEPSEVLERRYHTDTGLLLTIDALITGSHMVLPIRFRFITSVQVVGLLTYLLPAYILGTAERENIFRYLCILLVLIGLASVGKRNMERDERRQFSALICEKSLRFQSEFKLSQLEQRVRKEQRSGGEDMVSLPSTTESEKPFDARGKADTTTDFLGDIASIGVKEQWLVKPGEVTLEGAGRLLGEGGFGKVVQGLYQGVPVAIKIPKVHSKLLTIGSHLVELCNEIRILRRLRHPNIVLFYGAACDVQKNTIALILEYVEGVSLRGFMKRCVTSPAADPSHLLRERERSQILLELSCALRFLHSRSPAVVHGDLKDTNVYLQMRGAGLGADLHKTTLLDFGLSRVVTRNARPLGGTLSWVAPEVFHARGTLPNATADTFSFGRVAFYVSTGKLPFCNMSRTQIEKLLNLREVPVLDWPASGWLAGVWRAVVEECSSLNTNDRPTMESVHTLAQSFHRELIPAEAADSPRAARQETAVAQRGASACGNDRHHGDTPTIVAAEAEEGRLAGGAVADGWAAGGTRPMMPEYALTPEGTVVLLLIELMISVNTEMRTSSCCRLHGGLDAIKRTVAKVAAMPCSDPYALNVALGGQCPECGLLLRRPGGSVTSLPSAILECPFCEHACALCDHSLLSV